MDEEGYGYIVGRVKDMVIRGGENISSIQVEDVIFKIAGVAEAAVFGIKDLRLGEELCAAVCAVSGEQVTESQVKEYCALHLPKHMVPTKVFVTKALPRGPTGKIIKKKLREQFSS